MREKRELVKNMETGETKHGGVEKEKRSCKENEKKTDKKKE